jgi:2-phosphoglycerate kinase
MSEVRPPAWRVLLLGGSSGTGKTVVAERIGRQLGIAWLLVDDFRLALQRACGSTPQATADLTFFLQEHVWRQPPETLRDGLIAVGEVMTPALEAVIVHHVGLQLPAVIEGDGILPALLARPAMRDHAAAGHVRMVVVQEPDEQRLLSAMLARGRGIHHYPDAEQRTQARTSWLYGQWLAQEAGRWGIPVLAPQPWATLSERVLRAAESVVRVEQGS